MIEKSQFKTTSGQKLLKGLFLETSYMNQKNVIYTLKTEDYGDLPSLYRLYLESEDPTEYLFAETHLYDYEHWLQLTNCSWFKDYVDRWRRDLEVMLRAKALKRIMGVAKTGGRDAFTANKFILERGWSGSPSTHGRGRPSKEEIKRAAHEMSQHELRLQEDMNRLQGNENIVLLHK